MHPDLPDTQWFEAPDESSAHYGAAGWVPVPADVLAARDADEAHAVAVVDARMAGLPDPERPEPPVPAEEAPTEPVDVLAPEPAAKAKTTAKSSAKNAADAETKES
jgi:hypothetical protein